MSNINVVVLTGNLTRDPELRATASGRSVCSLRLAVNERVKDQQSGEWTDRANYFDVVTFGGQADNCAKWLVKGSPAAIEGRLRWREWEKDGQKRQAVEVVADNVQFFSQGQGQSQGKPAARQSDAFDQAKDFVGQHGSAGDYDDDDIPF